MTSSIDTAPAELLRLLVRQIPAVALVENSICESAAGANREEVALQPGAIRVDVEDGGSLHSQHVEVRQAVNDMSIDTYRLIPTTNHGTLGASSETQRHLSFVTAYHAKTHSFVAIHKVTQVLARSSN